MEFTKKENEIEKLKKTTLAEIVEYCCHDAQKKPCQGCPIYNYCINTDITKAFVENLYAYLNE